MRLNVTEDRYAHLIGKEIKGFKYGTHKYLTYNPDTMDRHLGEVGTIEHIWKGSTGYLVASIYFKSAKCDWSYPLEDVLKQLETLPESSLYEIF